MSAEAAGGDDVKAEEEISAIVCRIGNIAKLGPEDNYYDAGLSSIQALELLTELEAVFGVSLADDDFINARTVRALQRLIAASRAGGTG